MTKDLSSGTLTNKFLLVKFRKHRHCSMMYDTHNILGRRESSVLKVHILQNIFKDFGENWILY